MVGIKDVAALAGVSISTVSYVFSGKRPVSDATKIRVLKAVQQLDYHPGSGAAMLRRDRRTHLIVLSSPMHPYTDYSNYATFFFAVVARARHYHYNVVLLMDEDDTDELLRMSYSGMIDGVLLLDVTMEDPRVAQAHTSLVPYVSIGYASDPSNLLSVDVDFHAMGRRAVDEFYRMGHRHMLMIGSNSQSYEEGSNCLVRTKKAAIDRAQVLGIQTTFLCSTGDDARHVSQLIDQAFRLDPEITAIMAQTSISHMNNTIVALSKRGLSIPKNISMLALSTFGNASVLERPLDEIPMMPHETCSRGVDMLMECLEGLGKKPGTVELIRSDYKRRGSVGPVRPHS